MSATVKDYVDVTRRLDRPAFVEQHPHPFLIRRSQNQSLAPRDEYSSTLRMRIDPDTRQWRAEPTPPSPVDRVLPVVKRDEHSSFASKVLVGRTETNDLVVSHLTVSKHHAFFTLDADSGTTSLTDTGSTNGSQVNGQVLPPRKPRRLHDGDQVAFGDIEHLFYTAGGLYDVLTSLTALR